MRLTVLDLFCGCGGMALGFERAGYRILAGVDQDPAAMETFASNLVRSRDLLDRPQLARAKDITEYTCDEFHHEVFRRIRPRRLIDVIISGPPCQAFARIGRAKLRQVMKDAHAHLNDHRASLYVHLLGYVDFYRPKAVVIENVPDILNHGGINVAEEISSSLEDLGYVVQYTLLNAAHYGVPQLRTRFFLIAIEEGLGAVPSFPKPSHQIELPQGYRNLSRVATGQYSLFSPPPIHYVDPPLPRRNLPLAVTTTDALADLPQLPLHNTAPGQRRSTDREVPRYRDDVEPSVYALQMREWPRHRSSGMVDDHVIRRLPRDGPIFRRMKPGDDYRAARKIADHVMREKLRRLERMSGRSIAKGDAEYARLLRESVPPYDPSKFPNRWKKLRPDQPSHTLTAHLGKDSYSHIHYDSGQARVISVREAARLQSFPDGFRLPASMNAALRQIGNAVAPLIAYALAKELKRLLATGRNEKTE